MKPSSAAQRLFYRTCQAACWVFTRLMFRFTWSGREHIPPTGPVLVLTNHQSHLDPVFAGVASPRPLRAMARHELFFWPFSWLISALGAVPVDREKGAIGGVRATLKMLRDGDAVLLFPEGTRSYDGELQPLLPGFCALARRSGATIVPTMIDGAYEALPRGAKFPRRTQVSLVFRAPITPEQIQQLGDEELLRQIAISIDRHCV